MRKTAAEFAAEFAYASDSSVMIRKIDVLAVFQFLRDRAESLGIKNLHPAYESLLVDFDPQVTAGPSFLKALREAVEDAPTSDVMERPCIIIPVDYSNREQNDISEVAAHLGISEEDVIELHTKPEYTVAFLGFTPGFPYLRGLDPALRVPRKKTPRLNVPAGSVAIAGEQAGIYPSSTPAGWQILGRTELPLFSEEKNPPTLFQPGDRVRFVKSSAAKLLSDAETSGAQDSKAQRLVQRGPRWHHAHLGISAGGAADLKALRVGNLLVGNHEDASAIELTATGLSLTFTSDAWVAVTGAQCEPSLDQQPLAMWTSVPVCSGQRLVISPMQNGFRSYVCVSGGIADVKNGLVMIDGTAKAQVPKYRKASTLKESWNFPTEIEIRVTLGPQKNWFAEEALCSFMKDPFTVSNELSRAGIRLSGSKLEYKKEFIGKELLSEGTANGSVQVTSNGMAMIVFCEQQTTGGYPKVATVIRADWHKLGQLSPGMSIRFVECTLEQAWDILRANEAQLQNAIKEV